MIVYYRLSDSGYNKEKPEFINNQNCYESFIKKFRSAKVILVADNVGEETWNWCLEKKEKDGLFNVLRTKGGSSAAGFNICYDLSLSNNFEDIIFFVENDYVFTEDCHDCMMEAFSLGADYVTPYLHPDKFIPANMGGNPLVDYDGAQITKIYKSNNRFWMLTDSTTMTFASTVKTLYEDKDIIKKFTDESYPNDCKMFHALRERGRSLLQPIPSLGTHGETKWLSPTIGTGLNSWGELI